MKYVHIVKKCSWFSKEADTSLEKLFTMFEKNVLQVQKSPLGLIIYFHHIEEKVHQLKTKI
jgi:hypothetical protein